MKKLMMVLGALCFVPCAAWAGASAVPSRHVDIGTVGSDRVLHGGCVYEVTKNTTFIGANAGESGLIVAPGETVYIHINKGVTLTCAGRAGASAAPGSDGMIILCVSTPESKNFYCIGVTDDPRKDNR